MRKPASFWDWMAKRYAKTPIANMESYTATLDRTRSHLTSDMRVIEIGCGTGSTAIELSPAVAHYTATDYSEKMIAIGKAKADHAGIGNITFEVAEADATNTNIYDAVLAHNILHLVPDIDVTAAHAAGMLPIGGLFISKTPCLGPKKWLLMPITFAIRLIPNGPRPHLLFTRDLEAMIVAAGFEILESGQYPKGQGAHYIVARKTA